MALAVGDDRLQDAITRGQRRPLARVARTLTSVVLVTGIVVTAVRGQMLPPAPPALSVASVEGQAVTFQWAPPRPEDAPDVYVIEGGPAPGLVSAMATIPGSATTATFVLPSGTYYVRLRGIKGGVTSAPSNEVQAAVGGPGAPPAPSDVSVRTVGSSVVLTWRPTDDGRATSDILLEVSGAAQGVFVLPSTAPVTFSGVPDGTYTITLRARNALGVSGPSAPVTFSLPGGGVRVVQGPPQNINDPRLPVRYENFAARRLAEFVARERLDVLVQGAQSEFALILRLKDWVAAQWDFGDPNPYPPWDAMTILDWIRGGYTGGFCAQYSQVFVQALAAFGIPARYVEVGHEQNPFNHYPTEVWSNDFNKWVLMDASYNLHFERRGLPLSALEVHDAYVGGASSSLTLVRGAVTEGHPNPLELPHRTAELYYYLRYHLKANHVAAPAEDPFDRLGDMIEWQDGATVPWELGSGPSQFPRERPTRQSVSDRTLVNWRPNQVWITPQDAGLAGVTLVLTNNVLQFSHYEYRVIDVDGAAGPWRSHASSELSWQPSGREARLEVRGVNVRGSAGPASAVALASQMNTSPAPSVYSSELNRPVP